MDNNKIILETKGLQQYFPTGKKRNERSKLNILKKEILKKYEEEYNEKITINKILDKYNLEEINSKELIDILNEYIETLKVHKEKLFVKANDGIDLSIFEGETVGLVGESGCGKSTYGRTLLKLYNPTSGQIIYDGKDITKYSNSEMRTLRQDLQIIFQDPYSSLDPRMTVGQIIGEALVEHKLYKKGSKELEEYVKKIMKTCGLDDYMIYRYPHEFSGGQRQRIGIARSLALKPKFIVCDEAVSALDVSIQSQVINLLKDLQNKFNLSYLFISHDLSVVKHISDRIGVMYLGEIIELAPKNELYKNPLHPYTKALLSAIPEIDLEKNKNKEKIILEGDIPSNIIPPSGCKFHTRCPIAKEKCKEISPRLEEEVGHYVACHYKGEL